VFLGAAALMSITYRISKLLLTKKTVISTDLYLV